MTLFFTVLGASLIGSVHCAGMCGPLVVLYANDAKLRGHLLYHAGKLATYASLGAIAGALGGLVDLGGTLMGVAELAAIVAASVLVIWGCILLLERLGTRLPKGPLTRGLERASMAASRRILRFPPGGRALGLGFASALLPCGWLYAFVAVAAGTGSALLGALAMAGFWLGTVPMLLAIGVGAKRILGPLRTKAPVVAALALVAVGLVSVGVRAGKVEQIEAWAAQPPHGTPAAHDHSAIPEEADCH